MLEYRTIFECLLNNVYENSNVCSTASKKLRRQNYYKDQLSLTNPAWHTAARRTCDKFATEL